MARRLSPSQQAKLAANQRGIIQTKRGFTSQPVQIHPNDRYVRVFPDGPFDEAWEGVQKIVGGIMPGTHRMGGMWDPRDGMGQYATRNYLQGTLTQSGTISNNNAASRSVGAGPASYAAQAQAYAAQQNASPGLLSLLVNKLKGRS
jgi:hypothetical protein